MVSSQKSVLAAMGGVAIGGVMAFLLGSMLHGAYPGLPDLALAWIAVGSWVVIAFGVTFMLVPWGRKSFIPTSSPTPFRAVAEPIAPITPSTGEIAAREERRAQIKRDAERMHAAFQEAKRLRIAELAADPARSKYVPLMERGEWWTDEQIGYQENPLATATCIHLQAVESGMRSAGIAPRLLTEAWNRGFSPLPRVRADCCLHEPELRRRYPLPDFVRHLTGYQPERSEFDNPWAELKCSQCDSGIDLVHPEWPRPTTAWFPTAP